MNLHPLAIILLLSLPAAACADYASAAVANGEAQGGCEAATNAVLANDEAMLPGHACLVCHKPGASGAAESMTAAGTVFAKGTDACNPGGVNAAVVELVKADGSVAASATTDAVGNFSFSAPLDFTGQLTARIRLGAKVKTMPQPLTSGECTACHNTKIQTRLNVE